jgi:hypothetical protein
MSTKDDSARAFWDGNTDPIHLEFPGRPTPQGADSPTPLTNAYWKPAADWPIATPTVHRDVSTQLELSFIAAQSQLEDSRAQIATLQQQLEDSRKECADLRRAYNECWAGSPAVKAELESLREREGKLVGALAKAEGIIWRAKYEEAIRHTDHDIAHKWAHAHEHVTSIRALLNPDKEST